MVYSYCSGNKLVGSDDDPFRNWAKDPYDESIHQGALMNMSEGEEFDAHFPGFPLTMCRECCYHNMLEMVAPESFTVKPYVSIAELQVKHVG